MQSSTLNTKPANVMEDLNRRLNKFSEGARKNLQSLAYQRDPDTLLDEALIGLWILMIISSGFTLAFGLFYHYNIFQDAFGGAIIAILFSAAVFIVMEICKIYFGLHFLRAFFSMLWWKSLYRFLFTLLLGVVVVGAFYWSIEISTRGVAEVNKAMESQKLYQEAPFTPPPHVEQLNSEIAALENAKTAGAKSTWKGRTTQKGIKLMQSNTELQAQLIEERNAILSVAQAQHDSLQVVRKNQIMETSSMLTEYGGKAEYVIGILLILIVLTELIMYERKTPVVSLKK